MAKLVVLYPPPTDPAQFDKLYAEEHVPMCREKLKGMKLAVTHVLGSAAGPAPYHLIAELWAPTIADLQNFFTTADGQEIGGHAASISTGGGPFVLFCEEEVHEF